MNRDDIVINVGAFGIVGVIGLAGGLIIYSMFAISWGCFK